MRERVLRKVTAGRPSFERSWKTWGIWLDSEDTARPWKGCRCGWICLFAFKTRACYKWGGKPLTSEYAEGGPGDYSGACDSNSCRAQWWAQLGSVPWGWRESGGENRQDLVYFVQEAEKVSRLTSGMCVCMHLYTHVHTHTHTLKGLLV